MDKVFSFATSAEFRSWLMENHEQPESIWLMLAKKGKTAALTYAEALDEALCFGWIDGQKQRHSETAWLQRFSHRRPRSGWSKINTQHAERLMESGRMQSAGLAEVEAAKRDGRWAAAYDSPSNAVLPDDFITALRQDDKAHAFFESLNKANRYAIAYRLQTAKRPDTRKRRMDLILAMLARGEAFHP